MNISYNWLKRYIDTDLGAEEVARILTDIGLEVEGFEKIETVKGGLAGVVVGEVLTCEDHPDSDHLHVTTVDVGTGEPLQIVCGAQNFEAGDHIVTAMIGAVLPGDVKIKKSKLRGVVSMGMNCSARELGLGGDHSGIMILPEDTPCGMPFADFAHLEKSALTHGVLRYNRIKTGTPMSVEILEAAQKTINGLRNNESSAGDYPDYLFDIMKGDKKRKEEAGYKEYQSALRRFNNQLKSLSRELRIKSPVTSYTIRHSWATSAKYQGIPIEMISESLGHKSIKTTQTYLKGFGLEKRTEANKLNCFYVESYNTSHQ